MVSSMACTVNFVWLWLVMVKQVPSIAMESPSFLFDASEDLISSSIIPSSFGVILEMAPIS